ncbi:purine-nucleoside phosphorylase [Phanerochaete sordida]|uniref:purine-nucleoside phosphorylase n=1 Tax=Phanerochaete sordida TaxID=48140 RepID=A0A9P3LJY1_9APHY|nr:purine-nucleoside phosphorylase [Phanerochaete sordida]
MSVPPSPPHAPESVPPFAEALATLEQLLPAKLRTPRVGIVCGSGLSTLAKSLRDVVEVPYDKLAGFGKSTVQGHKSALAFGLIGEVPVVAMLGRFHPYEGHPMRTVAYPIRLLAKLGVKELLITNAVGALNPAYDVGSIVLIADHLALPNLAGPLNALFGPPLSADTPRFVPLSDAYSRRVRAQVLHAAYELAKEGVFGADAKLNALAPTPTLPLPEGTYAYVAGPTYETPAEGRFLRAAGADVVGMSTVPEVLAAREAGVALAVLSLVTNKVVVGEKEEGWVAGEVVDEIVGREGTRRVQETVSHEEVLEVGRQRAEVMRQLVERVVIRLGAAAA